MADLPIGAAIRHVRKTRGLSSVEVAKRMQVERTYVSKIEHGHSAPGLGVIFKFAAAMEVEPHKLVKLIHKMSVPNQETIPE